MKRLLLISLFVVLTIYKTAGQSRRCYSCSSNFGRFGSRNYNCIRNVASTFTTFCSSGSYCLTTYTVENGALTSLRRSCENPRFDYDQTTRFIPTENICVSSHSRGFSASDSVTCYFPCTTSRCNKENPISIAQCPDECPTTCDVLTGQCSGTTTTSSTAMRCVQCTSESDKDCETKTDATACPRSSHNYCATTRASVLNLQSEIVNTVVTKSCTTFSSFSRLPDQECRFRTNSNNNQLVSYSCSRFCRSNGCNTMTPGGTPGNTTRSSLRCVVCSQTGSSGSCGTRTLTSPCPASTTHCKSTASYYQSPFETSSGTPIYQLASLTRECANESVTRECTTTAVPNSNLQHITCQETCQTNGCNTGWPARPKCSQCSATNRTFSRRSFEDCRNGAFSPRQCSSPLFQYCTTTSNNTNSYPGFTRRVRRGCSITDIGTRCYDAPIFGRNTNETINHCQTSCSTNGCNEGGML